MSTNYEVWLNARHPKTLESVATVRVFTHADRLRAESVLENAHRDADHLLRLLRTLQPGAIINAEMRMPPGGVPAQVAQLEEAQRALDVIRAGKLARGMQFDAEGAADRRALMGSAP